MHPSIVEPARPPECPEHVWASIRRWRPLPAWAWLGYELLAGGVVLCWAAAAWTALCGVTLTMMWACRAAGFGWDTTQPPTVGVAGWVILAWAAITLGLVVNMWRVVRQDGWPLPPVLLAHSRASRDQVLALQQALERYPWIHHFMATRAGKCGDVGTWKRGDIGWLLNIAWACDTCAKSAAAGRPSRGERRKRRAAMAAAQAEMREDVCRQMTLAIEGLRGATLQAEALSLPPATTPAGRRRA